MDEAVPSVADYAEVHRVTWPDHGYRAVLEYDPATLEVLPPTRETVYVVARDRRQFEHYARERRGVHQFRYVSDPFVFRGHRFDPEHDEVVFYGTWYERSDAAALRMAADYFTGGPGYHHEPLWQRVYTRDVIRCDVCGFEIGWMTLMRETRERVRCASVEDAQRIIESFAAAAHHHATCG